MYIPTIVLAIGIIICIVYSTYKLRRTQKVMADLANSYNQVVLHLVSYNLNNCPPKKREETIKLCAKAIFEAAGNTVTTQSLMSTTDILSMCKIFQPSFKMREKFTPPTYEFEKSYDNELAKIQDEIEKDIKQYFN